MTGRCGGRGAGASRSRAHYEPVKARTWSSSGLAFAEGRVLLLDDGGERLAAPVRTLVVGEAIAQHEPDQALGAVEAAPEVVALAAGAVEEGAEVHRLEPRQLFRLVRVERRQQLRVARAHPHDVDRVPLAGVGNRLDRVEQDVPVREAEVADEQLGAPLRRPALAEPEQLPCRAPRRCRRASRRAPCRTPP